MERIKIFSVDNIKRNIEGWIKRYPNYEFVELEMPSKDCYVLFKHDLKKLSYHPIDAIIGAHRGYVEGLLNKPFSNNQIFTPMEFENIILKKESEMPPRQDDLNKELNEVILELMHKNEQLMIENAQLRAKLLEYE